MAVFELMSRVTITPRAVPRVPFSFSGVHDVKIKRSMHSYVDTAVLQVPRLATFYSVKGVTDGALQVVGLLINDGDGIKIELGYNGVLRTEFEGFVKRRNFGMPLEVECEGYSWHMSRNVNVTGYFKSLSISDALNMAVGNIDVHRNKITDPVVNVGIKVICNSDGPIQGWTLAGLNGCQIVDEVKKLTMNTLSIFFIDSKTLWCGFPYSAYQAAKDPFGVGSVSYRLGFNCVKDNGLKERVVSEPIQVIINGTYATRPVVVKSEADYAAKKEKSIVNNIPSDAFMKLMANEKQYRSNYHGYVGSITGFLEPACYAGYVVNVSDDQYKERNGEYLCEGVEVTFGVRGARRIVELGPLTGFDPKNITN